MYYRSVGHGCNLLMNLAPDNRGLIPDVDANAAYRLFDEMRRRFASPLARTEGAGNEIRLGLAERQVVDHVVLAERIEGGERVRDYALEARREDGSWLELVRGSAIGHKKIDRFEAVDTDLLRVRVLRAEAEPLFRSFAAYRAGAIR